MIHLYDGADPLGRSQAEHGYGLRLGNLVAIQRDHLEWMPGKGDPVNFAGAGIKNVEKNALACLDAQRLAETQDAAVDGRYSIDRIHRTVTAGFQVAIPIMQREEDLLVIARRIVAGFNKQKSMFTGVLALVQIFAGESMGVIPAEARRARGKRIARVATAGNGWSAFFH